MFHRAVSRLEMRECGLDKKRIKYLKNAGDEDLGIRVIDLSGNPIGDEGINDFLGVFKKESVLRVLRLHNI
jgi:hypothetical protein